MSDLVRRGTRPWGEDPHQDLAEARRTGKDVVPAEKGVHRAYMLGLRENFEKDPVTREILDRSHPATAGLNELATHLEDMVREETRDVFQKCLGDLLAELEQQRAAPASLYMVDHSTGRAVMPITEKMIFQPPDYVGEDGKVHKARPVLHPGIAAPLTLAVHEKERTEEAVARHGLAMEHVRNPDSIREFAVSVLEDAGFSVHSLAGGRHVDIEFGKEHVDALQSVNPRFHRHAAFGRSLAARVIEESRGGRECGLGPVTPHRNAKFRWYTVRASFPSP